MSNLTPLNLSEIRIKQTDPSEVDYIGWCIDQHIHFDSAVNQTMLLFIGLAWMFLIAASFSHKFKDGKYHESILHMARLSLVIVVAIWFLFVYLNIIWFQ